MRPLNTNTVELEVFGGNVSQYAILSHTWLANEVNFCDGPWLLFYLEVLVHKTHTEDIGSGWGVPFGGALFLKTMGSAAQEWWVAMLH